MFEYFKRIEGEDGKAGYGYRKRVHDTINSLTNLDDIYNLRTLLEMAKPISELSVPRIYSISIISDEYEAYLKDRYFMGLTVDEFEKDPVIMRKFKRVREKIILRFENETSAMFTDLENQFYADDEYGNAASRDKIRKPRK